MIKFTLQELTALKDRVAEINEIIPVTKTVQKSLWSAVIYCLFRALVQGFVVFCNIYELCVYANSPIYLCYGLLATKL